MQVSVFQIHKRSSYEFRNIQDKYSINLGKNSFAIADGTTQSLNSEIWAKQICDYFVANEAVFNSQQFIECAVENAKRFKEVKYEFSSNPAKAALERDKLKKGATATFIGASIDANNTLNIISVGDSNVFIIRGNTILKHPFDTLDELDGNNYFLNTEALLANEVDVTFFYTRSIQLKKHDIIILATDALSRLFLKDPKRILQFLRLKNFGEFHQFCIESWDDKILEEDDITALLILNNFQQPSLKEYLPPSNFSFPKEKEAEFIPASMNSLNFNNQSNDHDMQQIINHLNSMNKEISILKKKAEWNQILLYCLIGFCVVNVFLIGCLIYRTETSAMTAHKEFQREVSKQELHKDSDSVDINSNNAQNTSEGLQKSNPKDTIKDGVKKSGLKEGLNKTATDNVFLKSAVPFKKSTKTQKQEGKN